MAEDKSRPGVDATAAGDRSHPGVDASTDPQIIPDPADIPPPDSNEALHTAEAKRVAAFKVSGVGAVKAKAARERQAAQFAKAGSDAPPEEAEDADDTERRARSQAPQNRSTKPTART